MDPTPSEIVEQLQDAFRRIEYEVKLLREGENHWELEPVDGLYEFKGTMSSFIASKHTFDLLRETWHLGDGIREYINAKWRDGHVRVRDTNLDKGNGPGNEAVKKHMLSCPWIQLCADLANLTKHYRLVQKPKTGEIPPQLGKPGMQMTTSGKIDIGRTPDGGEFLKLERPVPIRRTMQVMNGKGEDIGDAIEIALKARDSWVALLGKMGITVQVIDKGGEHCSVK